MESRDIKNSLIYLRDLKVLFPEYGTTNRSLKEYQMDDLLSEICEFIAETLKTYPDAINYDAISYFQYQKRNNMWDDRKIQNFYTYYYAKLFNDECEEDPYTIDFAALDFRKKKNKDFIRIDYRKRTNGINHNTICGEFSSQLTYDVNQDTIIPETLCAKELSGSRWETYIASPELLQHGTRKLTRKS